MEHRDHTGQTFPSLDAMCDHWGIRTTTYQYRTSNAGWSIERALTTKPEDPTNGTVCYDHTGKEFPSVKAMLAHWGITKSTWKNRKKRGMTLEQILTTPTPQQRPDYGHTRHRPKKNVVTDHTGVTYPNAKVMCDTWGIPAQTYRSRIACGKTIEQALTEPVQAKYMPSGPTKDHTGKKFASVSEMCEHWGISQTTFTNRIRKGASIEKALTTPMANTLTEMTDYMGRTFPTRSDMGNYYGIGSDGFKRMNRKEPVFEDCIRLRYPGRTFGKAKVLRVLTFPYMLIEYENNEYVWTLEQLLAEYHDNGFSPIPKGGRKMPMEVQAGPGHLLYTVLYDGTEQIWDYWQLIRYYRSL